MKAAQVLREIPRVIYWLCGAVILLFLAGWLLFGTHSRDTGEQRVSSRSGPSASTISKSPNVPSRMILGEPLEARVSSKDNAATEWRKAFALMDQLTVREKSLFQTQPPADPPPTDAEIAALMEKISPMIALLRAGAAKPECDWGVHSHSFWTNTSQDDQGFSLGKIALWDSLQRVVAEPREAAENLKATARLGNSLHDGFHNEIIHQRIFTFLSNHTNSFSGSDRDGMQPIFDASNFAKARQASRKTDMDSIENSIRAFQTGQKVDGSPLTENEKKDFRTAFSITSSEIQLLGALREISQVCQESVYWPDDKFQNWLADFQRRNPVGTPWEAAGDSGRLRDFYRKVLVSQQMVNTGWAMMEEGSAAISRLRDPLTGKPFGYRVLDEHGSFELQSEVLHNGKPVTMTFPRTSQ